MDDQSYLGWEMPMARRQCARRPANGPIKHDPDRPLLMQMQLQLPNLPENS